jgi:hypothetical protein
MDQSYSFYTLQAMFFLAPSPGTGTVGDEKSEEAPDEQAFDDLFGRNTFHKPSLGKIEEQKS